MEKSTWLKNLEEIEKLNEITNLFLDESLEISSLSSSSFVRTVRSWKEHDKMKKEDEEGFKKKGKEWRL
jgi:hypothetical protein